MEQRSPWVPAELAPFFSQHHKWSWSRPEQSTVRLPLCADSIRNNCILASLHSSPLHHRGQTLYCIFCVVGYSKDPEQGEGHCSIVFFFFVFLTATCLWIARGVALKLHWCEEKKVYLSSTWFWGNHNHCGLHLQRVRHLKCYHYITSCKSWYERH